MIHLTGIAIVIFALFFWQIKQRSDDSPGLFPLLIGVGLLMGGYGIYSASMSIDEKFKYIIVDLIGMGALGWILRTLSWKYRNNTLIPVVVVSILFLLFLYQNIFQKSQIHYPENLAPNAELLVEIREGYNANELRDLLDKYQLTTANAFAMKDVDATDLDDYITVNIPESKMELYDEIVAELRATNTVEWLEGNEEIFVAPLHPEKKMPDTNKRFGVNDPAIGQQWALDAMGVDGFYSFLKKNKIKPKKKALIAILDTGVDAKHEDIKDNFKSTNAKYNQDFMGHGTHCAGIAGAVTNNGKGVASLAWSNGFVSLTSVQVLDKNGMGTQQKIINGILEAADNGADVISMSLGGRSNQRSERAYQKAMDYAAKKGAIVVVAAGNSNRNAKDYAPVNTKGVIGVSAVDQELNRAAFSNFVSDIPMGIAAPGVGVYSTMPGDKYAALSGTSMATPYVAGLLGMMKSLRPSLTTSEAYDLLKKTGKETKSTDLTGYFIQPKAVIESLSRN